MRGSRSQVVRWRPQGFSRLPLLPVEQKKSLRGNGRNREKRDAPRRNRLVGVGENRDHGRVKRDARHERRARTDATSFGNCRCREWPGRQRQVRSRSATQRRMRPSPPRTSPRKSRVRLALEPLRLRDPHRRSDDADRCPSRPPKNRLSHVPPRQVGQEPRSANETAASGPQDDRGKNADKRRNRDFERAASESDALVLCADRQQRQDSEREWVVQRGSRRRTEPRAHPPRPRARSATQTSRSVSRFGTVWGF